MKNHIPDPGSITSPKENALRKVMQRDRRVLAARAYSADEERRTKISTTRKAICAVPLAVTRRTANA